MQIQNSLLLSKQLNCAVVFFLRLMMRLRPQLISGRLDFSTPLVNKLLLDHYLSIDPIFIWLPLDTSNSCSTQRTTIERQKRRSIKWTSGASLQAIPTQEVQNHFPILSYIMWEGLVDNYTYSQGDNALALQPPLGQGWEQEPHRFAHIVGW